MTDTQPTAAPATAGAWDEGLTAEDRAEIVLKLGAWPVLTPEAQQIAEALGMVFAPIGAEIFSNAVRVSLAEGTPVIDLMIEGRRMLEKLMQDGGGSVH